VELDKLVLRLEADAENLRRTLREVRAQFDNTTKGAAKSTEQLNTSLTKTATMVGALKGALAALGLTVVGANVVRVSAEFEALNASLETVTGSAEAAVNVFNQLQKFAAATPFQLQEVITAFQRLKSVGLDPSMAALTAYGNVASGMSKPLMQFIEAVGDATTGEYERLEEFGIKASSEGNKVTFTFRGLRTTVSKDAAEIEKYLQSLGNVQFAGGMERQSKTLGQALSNLTDAMDQFYYKVGQSGASEAIQKFVRTLTDMITGGERLAVVMGQVIGGAFNGLNTALEFVRDNMRAIVTVMAAFIGLAVAQMAVTMGAAMAQLAVGILAAARSANILNTVLGRTPLGALARIAAAGAAAYGAWELFGEETAAAIQAAEDSLKGFEREAVTPNAQGVAELTKKMAELKREAQAINVELNGVNAASPGFVNLSDSTLLLYDGYENLGRNIQVTNFLLENNIDLTSEAASTYRILAESNAQANKEIAQAGQIFQATRTPLEQYNKQLVDLDTLLRRGLISQETYNRAIVDAFEKYQAGLDNLDPDYMQEAFLEAARSIQGAFSSAFETILEGGADTLTKLANLAKRVATQIAANIASAFVTAQSMNLAKSFLPASMMQMFGVTGGTGSPTAAQVKAAQAAGLGTPQASMPMFGFGGGTGSIDKWAAEALPSVFGDGGYLSATQGLAGIGTAFSALNFARNPSIGSGLGLAGSGLGLASSLGMVGAWGGPAGMALAVAAPLLEGLFSGGRGNPYTNTRFGVRDGRFMNEVTGDNGADTSQAQAQANQIMQSINSFMDRYGLAVKDPGANWETFYGDRGKSIDTAGDDLLGNLTGGRTEAIRAVTASGKFTEELLQQADAYEQTIVTLRTLFDTTNSAEEQLAQLNTVLDQAKTFADKFGLSLADATKEMAGDFNNQIRRALLAIQDPMTLELEDWKRTADARLELAKKLGADLKQVEALNAAERLAIVQKYTKDTATTEGGAVVDVTKLRDTLVDAYERESGAITQTRDRFRQLTKSLRDFREGLLLGSLSPLGPGERLAEARRQYQSLKTRAQLGDVGAMEGLPAASQAFLEASQSYYASGEEYFKDFQDVQQTLENTESVAERQARIADEQLTAMKSQLEQLGLLNQNVVSLATALAQYRAAVGPAGGAGGGAAGGGATAPRAVGVHGAFTSGDMLYGGTVSAGEELNASSVRALYQQFLGRDPEPWVTGEWLGVRGTGANLASALEQSEEFKLRLQQVRGYASGGMIQSGEIAKVHTGELIYTGPQAFVANAGQTRRMMGGGDAMLEQLVTLNRNIELLRRDTAAGSVVVATTVEQGNRVLANMASEQERRTA
jgi:hypothetical protein